MTHIGKHSPGSFCWIELATTDQNAAKSFYGGLFGWGVDDSPMGPGEFYSMFKLEGREVGAAYTMRNEEKAQGVPPHWNLYIAVEDADASAAAVAQLGGKVLAPAFDVFDLGRMAVIQDPTGGVLCLFQAKSHRGAGIEGVDGTLCWADLNTSDPVNAGKFYSGLFGWKIVEDQNDPSGYLHIVNGEDFIGGIPPAKHLAAGAPAQWLPYFQVSNCDTAAAKAKQLGANFYVEPMTVENVGRMAVLADPHRVVFSIFQPLPRE